MGWLWVIFGIWKIFFVDRVDDWEVVNKIKGREGGVEDYGEK